MTRIDCTFALETPEWPEATVRQPQLVVMYLGLKVLKVLVYFTATTGVEPQSGYAVAGIGGVKLYYRAASGDQAYAASTRLYKAVYTFESAQGMSDKFSFAGAAPEPRRRG